MQHDALREIIDRLIEDSGMSQGDATTLVARMLAEEAPFILEATFFQPTMTFAHDN